MSHDSSIEFGVWNCNCGLSDITKYATWWYTMGKWKQPRHIWDHKLNALHTMIWNRSNFITYLWWKICSYVRKWKYITRLYNLLWRNYPFHSKRSFQNSFSFSSLFAIQLIFYSFTFNIVKKSSIWYIGLLF